jgi:hypothetical protein
VETNYVRFVTETFFTSYATELAYVHRRCKLSNLIVVGVVVVLGPVNGRTVDSEEAGLVVAHVAISRTSLSGSQRQVGSGCKPEMNVKFKSLLDPGLPDGINQPVLVYLGRLGMENFGLFYDHFVYFVVICIIFDTLVHFVELWYISPIWYDVLRKICQP